MEETMKQKIGIFILLIVLALFAEPATIIAKCDTTCGDTSESATFVDDYIFLGRSLNFTGEAEDLYYLGESLDFNGKTRLGILALGQSIRMTGSTGNGIISGGEEVIIDGLVEGTSFIGSEKLWIRENAEVNGDLFAGSGRVTIDGIINGNMYLGAGQITINSVINGNVRVYGGRVIISPKGKINGNLTYSTKEKLSDEEKTRVSGTVKYDENKDFKEAFNLPGELFTAIKFILKLIISISFFIGGVLILFLPIAQKLEQNPYAEEYWQTALWGLIPICMYPAVLLILLLLGITIPIAIILGLAIVPLFFVAQVIGATMTGEFLAKKLKWSVKKRHYHFFIGATLFGILTLIPLIDILTMLLYSSLGWGVFITFLFNQKKSDKPESELSE